MDDDDPRGADRTEANAALKEAGQSNNRLSAQHHELHRAAAECAPATHREGTSLAGNTQIWLAQENERATRWRRAQCLIPRMRFEGKDVYERFELGSAEHATLQQLASLKGMGAEQFKSNAAAATLRLVNNYQRAHLDVANTVTYLDSVIAAAIDGGYIDFGNDGGADDTRARELSFAFQTAKNVLRFQTNELAMRGQHNVAAELSKLTNALGIPTQPSNVKPLGPGPQPTPTSEEKAQEATKKTVKALTRANKAGNDRKWNRTNKRGNRKRGRDGGGYGGQGDGKQARHANDGANGAGGKPGNGKGKGKSSKGKSKGSGKPSSGKGTRPAWREQNSNWGW